MEKWRFYIEAKTWNEGIWNQVDEDNLYTYGGAIMQAGKKNIEDIQK